MVEQAVVQNEKEQQAMNSPGADLEQMLIAQYLANKGYALADLEAMPAEQAKRLLTEASQVASLKLCEIDSTAHLWTDVEGKEQSHFVSQ